MDQDNLTGVSSTYTYDTSGRVKKAVVTGTGGNTYDYTYNARGTG